MQEVADAEVKEDDGGEWREVLQQQHENGVDGEGGLRVPLLQTHRVENVAAETFNLLQAVHDEDGHCDGHGHDPDEKQAVSRRED